VGNSQSWHWKGVFKVPVGDDKVYNFKTASDDGSWVFIDGKLVVGNGGSHGTRTIENSVLLIPGRTVEIEIFYGQGGGGSFFRFFWKSPSTAGGWTEDLSTHFFTDDGILPADNYPCDVINTIVGEYETDPKKVICKTGIYDSKLSGPNMEGYNVSLSARSRFGSYGNVRVVVQGQHGIYGYPLLDDGGKTTKNLYSGENWETSINWVNPHTGAEKRLTR